MSKRRVVVTGLGILSPLGNDLASSWDGIVNGRSGIGPITQFDIEGYSTRIGGEIRGFDPAQWVSAKDVKKMDTFIHYGIAAAMQAVVDAGLPTGDALGEEEATRIGCVIGSGIGGLPLIESMHTEYTSRGARRISPFFVPATIINMTAGHVSMKYGFKGPNISVVTACTTGLHAIGLSARMIEYGDADVMIAGGAESCVSPLGIGGFAAARALSTRNDDPKTASRPWDKDRDGFVLGEGAGVVVLEEYEHAKRRGARIYAELAGFGLGADAFHMTAPNVDGPKRSMKAARQAAEAACGGVSFASADGKAAVKAVYRAWADAVDGPAGAVADLDAHQAGCRRVGGGIGVGEVLDQRFHRAGSGIGIEVHRQRAARRRQPSPARGTRCPRAAACPGRAPCRGARPRRSPCRASRPRHRGGEFHPLMRDGSAASVDPAPSAFARQNHPRATPHARHR